MVQVVNTLVAFLWLILLRRKQKKNMSNQVGNQVWSEGIDSRLVLCGRAIFCRSSYLCFETFSLVQETKITFSAKPLRPKIQWKRW